MGLKAREESAKLIASKIESLVGAKETMILSGDFNAEPQQEPILVLKKTIKTPPIPLVSKGQ